MRQNLTVSEAFARYGATTARQTRAVSAIASDNSIVMLCGSERFVHAEIGVLRYEDQLSRESGVPAVVAQQLAMHLGMAFDQSLDVRLVVRAAAFPPSARAGRAIHVRQDLVGRVREFDGNRFVVDFTRPAEPEVEKPARRGRKARRG